jgi:hypothetical protein
MWGGGSVNPTKFLKPVENFMCRVKPIANTNDLLLFGCRGRFSYECILQMFWNTFRLIEKLYIFPCSQESISFL